MSEHVTELSYDEIEAVSGGLFFGDIQSNIAVVGQNAESSQKASNFAVGFFNVQANAQYADNYNTATVLQANVD